MRALACETPGARIRELPDVEIVFRVERRLRQRLQPFHLHVFVHRQRRARLHVALRKRRKVPERRCDHAAEVALQPGEVPLQEIVDACIVTLLEIAVDDRRHLFI